MAMLSAAVKLGNRLNFWNTKLTVVLRSRVRPASESCARSISPTRTLPEVGGVRPPMMWNSVDLPEPEGPMTARNSPAATSRSTPRNAGTSTCPTRKILCSSRIVIAGLSLIGEGLDGVLARGAQAGIQGSQQRADQ